VSAASSRWYVHLELYCSVPHSYPPKLKERKVREALEIADHLGRWRNVQSNGMVTLPDHPLYRSFRVPRADDASTFVGRFISELFERRLLSTLQGGSIRVECRTDGNLPTISTPKEHP
jgi:hypothetical protein